MQPGFGVSKPQPFGESDLIPDILVHIQAIASHMEPGGNGSGRTAQVGNTPGSESFKERPFRRFPTGFA